MARPAEYENLLKTGSFKEAVASRDSIAQFMRTAEEMQAGAKAPMPDSARFFLGDIPQTDTADHEGRRGRVADCS